MQQIILMKKNWSYIIGWGILFLLIIGAHFYSNSHMEVEEVVTEFWKEIVKEISIFARFNAKDGWETWLITGVSSLTFTAFIKSKNKKFISLHISIYCCRGKVRLCLLESNRRCSLFKYSR